MGRLIVLIGLPGSGKTFWSKEYISKHPNTKRVNRDTLREMVDFTGPYSKKNEAMNRSLRNACIYHLLLLGYDVISDDTNVYKDKRNEMIDYIQLVMPDTEIQYVQMITSIEDCIARDAARDRTVGEKVIKGMASSSDCYHGSKGANT